MTAARPLPRTFWILWFGGLLNRLGDFVQPFLAIYLTNARGLSPAQVGAVLSLWGLGALVSGPVGGLIADRFGRRRALLIATFSGACGMLHLGVAREIWHIALAAALVGFLGPLYRPAQQAAVVDLVEPAERPRAFALVYWAANLGFAFSAVVAGMLSRYSFTLLFFLDAATTVGYGFVVWRFVSETQQTRASVPATAHRDLLAPVRDPVLVAFLGSCLLTALVFSQCWCTLPLEIERHGSSPEVYGRLMAINGLLIVALQLAAVKLVRRVARPVVMAVSSLLVGVGFGAFGLTTGPLGYAAAITIWTLGEIAQMPVSSATVADLAPPERRGAYQGAFGLVFAAGNCLAPLFGGYVLQQAGSRWLWSGCLALGLGSALGHLAIGPAQRRRLSAIAGLPAIARA